MAPPSANTELIQLWEEYQRNLEAEADRAIEILKILDKGVKGLVIPPPPIIDFEALASGGAKINATKALPGARAPYGLWNKEIIEVLAAVNQYAPLLNTSELQMVIANKLKRELATKERNSISNSAGILAKDGRIGKTEDPLTGRNVFGDLKYFDGGNTLKPKYRHLLGATTIQPVEILGRQPDPPKLLGPIELSEKELEHWSWSMEIVKFLDEYDPTNNGLLSVAQIMDSFAARYSNFKNDAQAAKTLPTHVSILYSNGKIGRIAVKATQKLPGNRKEIFVYGSIKYFEKVPEKGGAYYSALKKEYDYLELSGG